MNTRQEAGRLGGNQTKQKHGKTFYKEIGSKGGNQTSKTHLNDFYVRIGTKGAQKVKIKNIEKKKDN